MSCRLTAFGRASTLSNAKLSRFDSTRMRSAPRQKKKGRSKTQLRDKQCANSRVGVAANIFYPKHTCDQPATSAEQLMMACTRDRIASAGAMVKAATFCSAQCCSCRQTSSAACSLELEAVIDLQHGKHTWGAAVSRGSDCVSWRATCLILQTLQAQHHPLQLRGPLSQGLTKLLLQRPALRTLLSSLWPRAV